MWSGARAVPNCAPEPTRLAGSGWSLKKLGLVSLTSKHVSLLGKFPIAERGKNKQEKRVSGPSSGGNPKLTPGGNCQASSLPHLGVDRARGTEAPNPLGCTACLVFDAWTCLGVKED